MAQRGAKKSAGSEKSNGDALSGDSINMEQQVRICVCNRRPKTLVCLNCKMFTYGRISQKCPEHANVTFLMDFVCCPNCLGSKQWMRGVDVDYGCCVDANGNCESLSQTKSAGIHDAEGIELNNF